MSIGEYNRCDVKGHESVRATAGGTGPTYGKVRSWCEMNVRFDRAVGQSMHETTGGSERE